LFISFVQIYLWILLDSSPSPCIHLYFFSWTGISRFETIFQPVFKSLGAGRWEEPCPRRVYQLTDYFSLSSNFIGMK
jgi:hypothetical protein